MSFDINKWLDSYTSAVKSTFGNRVWFIGLQGSYCRGEADDSSDIDVVLILDAVSYDDLQTYSKLLDTLQNRDMICGFISGKSEIELWEKSDLFQFCNDTTAIWGSLDALMQTITENDVKRAVRISACNIYHACAHNIIHEKSIDILKELYKSAAFTLQAIAYLQTGIFEKKQDRLSQYLQKNDKQVLDGRLSLKKCECVSECRFSELSSIILEWASFWIKKVNVN